MTDLLSTEERLALLARVYKVAAAAAFADMTIAGWAGGRQPTLELLEHHAFVAKVEPAWLAFGEGRFKLAGEPQCTVDWSIGLRRALPGLSANKIADRVGVARTQIGRWTRGEYAPRLATALKVARALGRRPGRLWFPREAKP